MFVKLLQLEKLDTNGKLRDLKSVGGERSVGMYAERMRCIDTDFGFDCHMFLLRQIVLHY